jgi:hypothetical protein
MEAWDATLDIQFLAAFLTGASSVFGGADFCGAVFWAATLFAAFLTLTVVFAVFAGGAFTAYFF